MDEISCYRKSIAMLLFLAYRDIGYELAGLHICRIISVRDKIFQKTADKQKDVRYNGDRTKSNAALSMEEKDSFGVLPANTK